MGNYSFPTRAARVKLAGGLVGGDDLSAEGREEGGGGQKKCGRKSGDGDIPTLQIPLSISSILS